ncbi:MAG: hypothetical protein KGQ59_09195 [Bdellovibrionales bacterium]|nr:hypothetical protein [Bdellovibrionales bacterium]
MKMKSRTLGLIALLLSIGTAAIAGPTQYESCCFCIQAKDDFLKSLCDQYYKKHQCGLKAIFDIDNETFELKRSLKSQKVNLDAQCTHVDIFGAFHGLSSTTKVPFTIARKFAEHFKATSLCYDGATCLAFNNIEDVRAEACNLGESNLDCRFVISGNQNIGVASNPRTKVQSMMPNGKGGVTAKCIPSKETDRSRMAVVIDGVNMHTQFAKCSKAGEMCAEIAEWADPAAKSDPNSKWCIHEGAVVQQRCCGIWGNEEEGYKWGKWAAPGQACEKKSS